MEMIIHTIAILLLATLICGGVHIITSGRWVNLPDGTKYHTGKLLHFVSRFFDQHDISRNYYTQALELCAKINEHQANYYKVYPKLHSDNSYGIIDKSKFRFKTLEDLKGFQLMCEELLDCKLDIVVQDETYEIRFYKEIKNYKFSDYIKDPILNCMPCMASFWGVPTYIIAVKLGYLDYGSLVLNIFMLIPFLLALVRLNHINKEKFG